MHRNLGFQVARDRGDMVIIGSEKATGEQPHRSRVGNGE
jgi:hypothetical protein